MPTSDDVMQLAEACAARVSLPRRVRRYPSFAEVEEQCADEYEDLLGLLHEDDVFAPADLERQDEVPERGDTERHDPEEDHDRAVHRAELVVELGRHEAVRHALFAEEPRDQAEDEEARKLALGERSALKERVHQSTRSCSTRRSWIAIVSGPMIAARTAS